jgi:hypothetical protein
MDLDTSDFSKRFQAAHEERVALNIALQKENFAPQQKSLKYIDFIVEWLDS